MKAVLPALILIAAALPIGFANAAAPTDPAAAPDAQAPMATAPATDAPPLEGRRRPGRPKT